MQKTTATEVREATKDDLLDCLLLFKQFHRESAQPFNFDVARTSQIFEDSLSEDSPVKFFVADSKGEIVGFVCCIVYQHLFSTDKTANELAWFVAKEHRGGSAAIRLMKTYEAWAMAQGVRCITMSHIEYLADLTKLYKKLGYSKIESTFQKEI